MIYGWARYVRKSNNQPKRRCQLAAAQLRFAPLNCFLWGAFKDKFYANHPETIDDVKHEIEVAIEAIENVLKNWVDRVAYCKASRGSHMN